jgi:hypothetical protein
MNYEAANGKPRHGAALKADLACDHFMDGLKLF